MPKRLLLPDISSHGIDYVIYTMFHQIISGLSVPSQYQEWQIYFQNSWKQLSSGKVNLSCFIHSIPVAKSLNVSSWSFHFPGISYTIKPAHPLLGNTNTTTASNIAVSGVPHSSIPSGEIELPNNLSSGGHHVYTWDIYFVNKGLLCGLLWNTHDLVNLYTFFFFIMNYKHYSPLSKVPTFNVFKSCWELIDKNYDVHCMTYNSIQSLLIHSTKIQHHITYD